MWFWGPKLRLGEQNISAAQISAYDRFDLRLQELITAQQHYVLFPALAA